MNDDCTKMNELISYMQRKFSNRVHATIERFDDDANKIELALGLKLPKSYSDMVSKFGTLGVMGNEFLGTPYNPQVTLDSREDDTY